MDIKVKQVKVKKYDHRFHIDHIMQEGIEKKQCARCKEYKPLADFSEKTDGQWDYLQPYCKACNVEYHRIWYMMNQRHVKYYNMKRGRIKK